MSEKDAQGHRLQRMQIIHDNSWDVMFDGYKRQQAKHNPYAGNRRTNQQVRQGGVTKRPSWNLRTIEMYKTWMTKHSDDNRIVTTLYDQFDEATAVLARQWLKGQWQYLL
jgi:hypothetical protein